MDELDMPHGFRSRRFHVRKVKQPYTEGDLTSLLEFIEEQCKDGWEPFGMFTSKDSVILFLKHYCTQPRKDCVLCLSEAGIGVVPK